MKTANVLKLISNLELLVSANDHAINNFSFKLCFIGTSKETYVETRLRLCIKEKANNSISPPPDSLSYMQVIRQANYQ